MLTHSQDFGTVYTLMLADGEGYVLREPIFSRPIPIEEHANRRHETPLQIMVILHALLHKVPW